MADCSTENIRQTLFLGCSIERFSCNLGFNEQPTEVSVRIIKDDCPATAGNPKIYYDPTNFSKIEKNWTAADPGFNIYGPNNNEPPRLGAPVYFRFGNFEFMGLLQSWTKVQTETDKDIYEVKLVSPVEILEGCQLILGDYTGPIKGFNIFNVYGFQEVFSPHRLAPSYTDPRFPVDGPIMGSFSGAFGGANVNKVGMTWNKIKEGVQILTSSLISARTLNYEEFSEVGRIVFYGGQFNARFGLIPYDEKNLAMGLTFGISADTAHYFLDISELPEVPDNYRVAGPSISLLSLISQICNDFGRDYYLELVPVVQGNNVLKFIKIRTILRNIQPDTTIVQSFVDATPEVIDSSFGRELRNENTTTFLVGGQKQSIVQVDNGKPNPLEDPEEFWLNNNFGGEDYVRDRIVPYFGKDTSGNAYILHTTSGIHLENFHPISNLINHPMSYYINFDFRNRHNWVILDALLPNFVPVTIGEMRCASIGYDVWSFHVKAANTVINQYITGAGFTVDNIFNSNIIHNPHIQPRDLANLRSRPAVDQFRYELTQYVQMLANIYEQSKRTLMVRVPWVKARYSIDTTTIANSFADLDVLYTDESCEGGWTEAKTILYLGNPSVYIDRMRNQDGSIKAFGMFDLPNTILCEDITGGYQIQVTDPNNHDVLITKTETQVIDTLCRSVSQTAQTLSEFDTPDSFAVDRTLVPGLTGEGKILYYGCTQELEPVFLDRINLISPRILIQFSQPLDFWTDTPNGKFNSNGWAFNSPFMAEGQSVQVQNSIESSVEKEIAINKANPPIKEPDKVAIALKSNVHTYGPWKPNNVVQAGPPGQIRFEKQDDLVPWNFGSVQNLDTIAQLRANESVTIMSEGEVGNITIHGVPDIPLGAELASLKGLTNKFFESDQHLLENRSTSFDTITLNDTNGNAKNFNIPSINYSTWNGSFGPTVTSISIDFSPDGITTNYGFRTFTPKFGLLSKLNAQRLENRLAYENHRRAQLRFIEESRKVSQRYIQSLRQISNASSENGDIRAHAGTPHSVLVGQLTNWGLPSGDIAYSRSIIASKDLHELQNNLTHANITGTGIKAFDRMAIMSWDGLIRPVSVTGGGGLPRFASIDTQTYGNLAQSQPPFNIVTGVSGDAGSITGTGLTTLTFLTSGIGYNLVINQSYLNPLAGPIGPSIKLTGIYGRYTGAGHDIDIIARRTLIDFTGDGKSLIMPIDISGYSTSGDGADYASDYRFLALRGPLVVHGWGYDTDGKPVPNKADTELVTSGGVFASTGLQDKFLPNFLKKPHTWPVAPVDLRYDRQRGVWVSPANYHIIEATVTECNDNGTVNALLHSDRPLYNADGILIPSGIIEAVDVGDKRYFPGNNILAYYSSLENIYKILEGAPDKHTRIALVTSPPGDANFICCPTCDDGPDIYPSTLGYALIYEWDCDSPGVLNCGDQVKISHWYGPSNFTTCVGVHFASLGRTLPAGTIVYLTSNTDIKPGMVHGENGVQIWGSPVFAGSKGALTINGIDEGTGVSGGGDCCDNFPSWLNFSTPEPLNAAGCGLQGNAGVISVYRPELVGRGLQNAPGNIPTVCSIAFFPDEAIGKGLEICNDNTANNAVRLKVKPSDIAGFGLKPHDATSQADNTTINTQNAAGPVKVQLEDQGYLTAPIQIFGHGPNTTTPKWDTLSKWLNTENNYDVAKDQYFGHIKNTINVDEWIDAGQLKVDNTDGLQYLIDKIKDTSTYDADNHQLVYAQSVDSTPTKHIRLFTDKSTGGGLLRFKLTEDKDKSDTTTTANLIGCTGIVDITGAILHDRDGIFYGLSGYHGYANAVNCTGLDTIQYEIASIEEPALYVIATLNSDLEDDGSSVKATIVEYFGSWPYVLAPIGATGSNGLNSNSIVEIFGDSWQGGTLISGTKVLSTIYDDSLITDFSYKLISPAGSSSTSKIVLIDNDITGVTECTTSNTGTFPLWSYGRKRLSLKYYRDAVSTDSCYIFGMSNMVLATGNISTTGGFTLGYLTTTVFYDDGKTFTLGEYTRDDYPTFPENEIFPPVATPSGYLQKRYRGIVTDNILITSLCKALPSPPLDEFLP